MELKLSSNSPQSQHLVELPQDLVNPTHPSRLFLALLLDLVETFSGDVDAHCPAQPMSRKLAARNYSVFLHGLGDEDRAIAVARTAFEAFRLHGLRA